MLYVMLIVGLQANAPAVIPGFHSMASCVAATGYVTGALDTISGKLNAKHPEAGASLSGFYGYRAACVALKP